jgi:hypothetical protein
MLPTAADVHVNRPLTNISVAALQEAPALADLVFPTVEVQNQSDVFFKFNTSDMARIEMGLRAPGTEAKEAGYRVDSSTSYFCKSYALKKTIPVEVRRNSDQPLDPDRNAVQFLMQQAKLKREKLFAAAAWTTSIWTTDVTGSSAGLWSDNSSDPAEQIETYKTTILGRIGRLPNTLAMNHAVWAKLKNHPLIVDRFKHTSAQSITKEMVAALFEIDRLVVGSLYETSSKEGNATQTLAAILGNHALLCYVPTSPGLETPAAGYTFAWNGSEAAGGLGSMGVRTYKRFDDSKRADEVEVEQCLDHKVVMADAGVFFNTII